MYVCMCVIWLGRLSLSVITWEFAQRASERIAGASDLIPYNPELRFFFNEKHLAQTISPIVLYTHAKD